MPRRMKPSEEAIFQALLLEADRTVQEGLPPEARAEALMRKLHELARARQDGPVKAAKVAWRGTVTSVQPRIRLTRSFDERNHGYLGYVLGLDGEVGGERRRFTVAIGKAAHAKHEFRSGDEVSGVAEPVADAEIESAELYKASKLELRDRAPGATTPPPWTGVAPPRLEVYRARGHRRLDARSYRARCRACIWGCRMPVEIIIDKWKPDVKRHRFETFCYGPKRCSLYRAGPKRMVPGRNGMCWIEDDWVDADATAHRDD